MSDTGVAAGIEVRPAAPLDAGAQPRPYAPSWVNHFLRWLDGLPIPTWAAYAILTVAVALPVIAIPWLSGLAAAGTIDPAQIYYGVLVPLALALIRYLEGVARSALDSFAPLLDESPEQIARWRYELTVIPARPAAIWLVLMLLAVLPYYAADPVGSQTVGYSPIALAIRAVDEAAVAALLGLLAYQGFRQMRLVGRIHERASRINLFDTGPLYAFSRLTSRTAIGVLLIQAPAVLFFPVTPSGAIEWLAWFIPVVVIAAAVFVLPLNGMHRRIAEEKERLETGIGQRLERILGDVHVTVDGGDRRDADVLNKTLASLVTERQLVGGIRTWPWATGTLAAFGSAVLLPVGLWFVTRLLERVI